MRRKQVTIQKSCHGVTTSERQSIVFRPGGRSGGSTVRDRKRLAARRRKRNRYGQNPDSCCGQGPEAAGAAGTGNEEDTIRILLRPGAESSETQHAKASERRRVRAWERRLAARGRKRRKYGQFGGQGPEAREVRLRPEPEAHSVSVSERERRSVTTSVRRLAARGRERRKYGQKPETLCRYGHNPDSCCGQRPEAAEPEESFYGQWPERAKERSETGVA